MSFIKKLNINRLLILAALIGNESLSVAEINRAISSNAGLIYRISGSTPYEVTKRLEEEGLVTIKRKRVSITEEGKSMIIGFSKGIESLKDWKNSSL